MTNCTYYNSKPTQSNKNSPVLMLGNSFLDWPKNCALCTAVAKYTLAFPEIKWSAGCFTSVLLDMLLSPEQLLRGKKVVVIPISVGMMEGSKFWNIQQLDIQLSRRNKMHKECDIPLPPAVAPEKCNELSQLVNKRGVTGTFYFLGKTPLHLKIPHLKNNNNGQMLIKLTFANNAAMTCRYGKKNVLIGSPALFMFETLFFNWVPSTDEIIISPIGKNRQLFIADFSIYEVHN